MTIERDRLEAVVVEAVAGDRNALREVLETIRPIVVRYCRARIGTIERKTDALILCRATANHDDDPVV